MIAEYLKGLTFKFSKFASFPIVKAEEEEEELIDPYTALREKCRQTPEGQKLLARLTECNTRVRSKKSTAETCEEELHDLFHYVDHCAAKDVFRYLK